MLNKIMMTGRITTDLNVVTEQDYSYCKFSIAVDQPKRNGIETTETIYSLVSHSKITQSQ